ncbi:MAG: permease [Deltaproteobacteria bacterium]|nr:permease [Deltaproteobacteria bacterium]
MFKSFADIVVYNWLSLDSESHIAEALDFFIEDVIKIGFLILLIISLMGVITSYFPVTRVRKFLENRRLFGLDHLLASLLGAFTPFCSCSSIPLFMGFLKGGIPLGVTLSFLITSPLVNEVAIVIFLGLFGVKITLIYAISGILLGTLTGALLGKFKLEKYLEPWVKEQLAKKLETENIKDGRTFKERIPEIKDEAIDTFKRIMPYVVGGVAIGGLIHGFIPAGYFEEYMGRDNIFAVPLSVILAVPMYSNASGVIPVIQSLIAKGIPVGTALAFMMAVVGLSFPEAMLLKKVMNLKLIAIYFSTTGMAIIVSGYLFNLIL